MDTFCADTASMWKFIGDIIYVIRIVIPVIIILLGTLDLGKAVMAGEDKQIKAAQKMLLMRIIYGVAIFFIVLIIQVVFGLVGGEADTGNNVCFKCVGIRSC